jgi:hypothetical protein
MRFLIKRRGQRGEQPKVVPLLGAEGALEPWVPLKGKDHKETVGFLTLVSFKTLKPLLYAACNDP